MKKLLEKHLRFLSKRILKKYKPKIIGITGSVGKTSAKEAIYSILKEKYRVRKNIKNYNNEIGVPLTIIGAETGGKNLFKWLVVCWRAWSLILLKKQYPEILVLEMGIDRPGDMKYLVSIVKCDFGVVTAIGDNVPVHVEFFKDIDHLVREKRALVESLYNGSMAVLNFDDQQVIQMQEKTRAQIRTFGFQKGASMRAIELNVITRYSEEIEKLEIGLNFKIEYHGNVVPVYLPRVLGEHQVYAALIAALVAMQFDFNLIEVANHLKNFKSPKGRMNLIQGIKHTLIIDDSYNASPPAVLAALKVLAKTEINGKKWAVLGNMAELGKYTEKGHSLVGQAVVDHRIDYLVTVGAEAKIIADKAEESGMSKDMIYSFSESPEAGKFVQEKIEQGDLILVKGSQSVRTEKIVKEIMAEPLKVKELLVRQDKEWENK